MSYIYENKISQMRLVKGVSKKKLKAQEYHLKRKMGICFKCTSSSHTYQKCPEKAVKHNTNTNVPLSHTNETSNEIIQISSQQIIQAYIENNDEKCNNMLTDMDVDKCDSILIDNLVVSLCQNLYQDPRSEFFHQKLELNSSCSFIDEQYIPVPEIIPRGYVLEKSETLVPNKKKSTNKVERLKKFTIDINAAK